MRPTRSSRVAAALFALGLVFAGCSNSDADGGDTQPRNNTEDGPVGSPGAPVPNNSEGEGTGTGRAEP